MQWHRSAPPTVRRCTLRRELHGPRDLGQVDAGCLGLSFASEQRESRGRQFLHGRLSGCVVSQIKKRFTDDGLERWRDSGFCLPSRGSCECDKAPERKKPAHRVRPPPARCHPFWGNAQCGMRPLPRCLSTTISFPLSRPGPELTQANRTAKLSLNRRCPFSWTSYCTALCNGGQNRNSYRYTAELSIAHYHIYT